MLRCYLHVRQGNDLRQYLFRGQSALSHRYIPGWPQYRKHNYGRSYLNNEKKGKDYEKNDKRKNKFL